MATQELPKSLKPTYRDSLGENGCRLSDLLYMLSNRGGEMLPVILKIVEKSIAKWQWPSVYANNDFVVFGHFLEGCLGCGAVLEKIGVELWG